MKKSSQWLLVFAAFLASMPAVPANADDGADYWVKGQQAFEQQDYLLALSHFQGARKAGQTGSAVHYNIGVCQYKLRQYAEARRTFTLLDDEYPKMRPLAKYNLGLVALKQSQRETAIRHFRDSYYLSTAEPKLRAMSSTMLRRMIGETVPRSRWLRTFSLRAAYDDNVALQDQTSLSAGFSADSPLVEMFGTFRGPYAGRNGFRLDGAFFLLNYSDAEEFNQAAVQIGGIYDWNITDWGLQFGAHGGTSTLGGDGFDRSARLNVRLKRRLTAASSLDVRYRYDDITAVENIFDGIEGSRQRVDFQYRWYMDGRSVNLGFGRETNDRADPSVSPERSRFSMSYRHAPAVGWGFEIGGELRASEYGDMTPVRDEDLMQMHLGVSRHLESGWQLLGRYSFAENDSSDPVFTYTRNQFSIGAIKFF